MRIDDAFLSEMRLHSDPVADALVAELFDQEPVTGSGGAPRDPVRGLWRLLLDLDAERLVPSDFLAALPGEDDGEDAPAHELHQDAVPAIELPPALLAFVRGDDTTDRIDSVLEKKGQALFAEHGPEILLALACYSLPASYAANAGVKVLAQTGFLESHANRRLMETTQMVINVMQPGSLDPGSLGFTTARKVRLMHAAIRHLILAREGDDAWDIEGLGLPINQEDLAGTLMTFAWLPLEALSRMGIHPPEEQAEAYLQTWAYIGRVMGLREELIPSTLTEAEELTKAIQARQVRPDLPNPDGKALTKALLAMMEGLLPGRGFDAVPACWMRLFLPTPVSESLEVPRHALGDFLLRHAARVFGWLDHLALGGPLRKRFVRRTSLVFVQAVIDFERGGKRTTFSLPLRLRGNWQLW